METPGIELDNMNQQPAPQGPEESVVVRHGTGPGPWVAGLRTIAALSLVGAASCFGTATVTFRRDGDENVIKHTAVAGGVLVAAGAIMVASAHMLSRRDQMQPTPADNGNRGDTAPPP